jgi:hypothetical protein
MKVMKGMKVMSRMRRGCGKEGWGGFKERG